MKLRGIASELTPEQRATIGGLRNQRGSWAVHVGKLYLAYGLFFTFNDPQLGSTGWVLRELHPGVLAGAPLVLFDVVDPRPSGLWRFSQTADGIMHLEPEAVLNSSLVEDAADGKRAAREQVAALTEALDREFD
jgi:hypothetical protein